MRLVGLGLVVGGPLTRILHRQGGDDDEDLARAAHATRLDEHAPEAWVEWEPGQRLPVCREPAVGVEGLQLLQQPYAVGHLARIRRVDERKGPDVAEPERRHLED